MGFEENIDEGNEVNIVEKISEEKMDCLSGSVVNFVFLKF